MYIDKYLCLYIYYYEYVSKCLYTQPIDHKPDVIQDQFLSRIKLVCIQSFPSPRMVVLPRLKNTLDLTICILLLIKINFL